MARIPSARSPPATDFNADTGDGVMLTGTIAGDSFTLNARTSGWFAFAGGESADTYIIKFNDFSTVRLDFSFGLSLAPSCGVSIDLRTGDVFNDGIGNVETVSISSEPGRLELQGTGLNDSLLGSDFDDGFQARADNDKITGFGGFDCARDDNGQVTNVNVNLAAGAATYLWNGVGYTVQLSGIERIDEKKMAMTPSSTTAATTAFGTAAVMTPCRATTATTRWKAGLEMMP